MFDKKWLINLFLRNKSEVHQTCTFQPFVHAHLLLHSHVPCLVCNSEQIILLQVCAVRPAVRHRRPCRGGEVLSAQGNSFICIFTMTKQSIPSEVFFWNKKNKSVKCGAEPKLTVETMHPPMYSYENSTLQDAAVFNIFFVKNATCNLDPCCLSESFQEFH
jgi:hypothetical protein